MIPFRRHRLRSVFALAVAFLFVIFLLKSSSLSASSVSESDRLEAFMNHGSPKTPINIRKSSFDWSQVSFKHLPPVEITELPAAPNKRLPRVQHAFGAESPSDVEVRRSRRDVVRRIFQYDWDGYRKFAWKRDALNPLSGTSKDQFSGWAATLVDSLDTLWIMGLRDEFDEAVAAVAEIDFGLSTSPKVNIFEPNIRYLGGLLSAYDLSGRAVLLEKATDIGNLIYAGFNTPSNMPVDFIDFEKAEEGEELEIEDWVVAASPGTLSLEMTRLSQITGDPKYYDASARVMRHFHEQQQKSKIPGLWPMWVSMKNINLSSRREFTFGSGADSLFEYLPKMHALLGGSDPMYEEMTRNFMAAASKYMFFRPMLPGEEDILISGNVDVSDEGDKPIDPESEHLTCFIGGSMALGGRLLEQPDDVETGAKLAKGCAYAYSAFPSGIMPERYNMVACDPRRAATCRWNEQKWIDEGKKRKQWKDGLPKGFTTAKDARYLLRPEAIESLFMLYRTTGDKWYQETAWTMFQAVDKASKTKNGHATVRDVNIPTNEVTQQSNLEDYLESFWFAETLKYYYLIFSPPDLIDLDDYVLNTEAHPFKRPNKK